MRRGEWIWTQFSTWRAHESVGLIHQIEHWRNDERARNDTDDQCYLLLPWRCIDQLASLEVLQVIVRNRGDVEYDGGGKKRECHQGLERIRPDVGFHAKHEEQRGANYNQDPDA